MQGNSLLEDLVIGDSVIKFDFNGGNKFDGRTKEQRELFKTGGDQQKLILEESDTLAKKLEKYHSQYFDITDPEKKKILKKKIDSIEDELIQSKCQEEIRNAESTIRNHPNDSRKIQKNTEKMLAVKEVLNKWKIDHLRPFFPWRLHFSEVFNRENGGFDVVIANPPYDVYQGHKKDEIEQLNQIPIYHLAKGGKLNAYKLFLAKSTQLQKNGGIICEIFQNSFLTDNSAKNIRKEFIINQNVVKIDSFPERDDVKKRVFESVKMSVCILLSKNISIANYDIKLNIWDDKFMKNGQNVVLTKSDLQKLDVENLVIPLASNEEFIIIRKLSSISKLREFARCYQGEINLTVHKKLLRKELNKNSPMIKGAAIQKWHIRDKMSQGEIEYIDSIKYLEKNKGSKSRHYAKERIVMQGITGVGEKQRLKSTILNAGIFCAHSVNYIVIQDNKLNNKFFLALLNSKLLNWYFKIFSTNSNVNGYEVDNLPILQASENNKMSLIKVVDKILEVTKSEDYISNSQKQAKVREYEKEIDQMVYKLYGLTEEEIKIIEGKLNGC
jgi:Alw26I/Eco31I/Esp3I family type II restriction m6 adenine DNA methyltransferase